MTIIGHSGDYIEPHAPDRRRRQSDLYAHVHLGDPLAALEVDILRHLADGQTVRRISEIMDLTEPYCWVLIKRARIRLEARTTAQVVAAAIRKGLI